MKDWTRRAFLKLTAYSGATLFSALGVQFPDRLISSPEPPGDDYKQSQWLEFPTTCRECPAGCGMRVMHIDGRATKAEAVPAHPVSRGGLCPRGQSALQGLYDPDRVTTVMRHDLEGQIKSDWRQALEAIGPALRNRKGRLLILSGMETGTSAQALEDFASAMDGELLYFEPFDYDPLLSAHEEVFGRREIPLYHLDRAGMILSFGADFLESWISNVEFAWRYAEMNEVRNGDKGRFAYVGPLLTMTAANAEDFIQTPPSLMSEAAWYFLKVLSDKGLVKQDTSGIARAVVGVDTGNLPAGTAIRIERLAEHFGRADGAVALAGPVGSTGPEAGSTAKAAALINYATGNVGRTVDFSRTHALGKTAPRRRVEQAMSTLGEDDILLLHRANPAYVMPQAGPYIRNAGLVVALDTMPTESAASADWILPVDSPLESWGDYEPWTGIRCIMQPAMQRMYDTRPAADVLSALAEAAGMLPAGESGSFQKRLMASWRRIWRQAGQDGSFEDFMREVLQKGRREEPAHTTAMESVSIEASVRPAPQPALEDEFELWAWGSILLHDGRIANRTWIQTAPHPVSYICWGNWLDIHPERARALDIKEDDLVEIEGQSGRILRLPARVTDEISQDCAALCFGQGHEALGETAKRSGGNAFTLTGETGFYGSVRIRKTGETKRAVYQNATRDQHQREVLQWTRLDDLKKRPESIHGEIDMPIFEGYDRSKDIYKGHHHAGHRWAMVVDLHRCIGCGACAVACYAENNIPVYGPDALLKEHGRELSWLKVVPYLHENEKHRLGWLPMLCQQCDQAPCEPVCPVFAAVHNEEGLNSQIYNRCIGTRYCSNNCPYKVRRFNWFNPEWPEPLNWQLNPDVSVRCRGVMEKCTFCVQRIRRAEYRAKIENREIQDGEITPACAQTCPTGVFTFGDLLDENSQVSRMFRSEPRRYQLLGHLNTKPAVLYLMRVERGHETNEV